MNLVPRPVLADQAPVVSRLGRTYSRSGTFDGLVPNYVFLHERRLPRAPTRVSPAAVPCDKWVPYCVPILDQRASGMCQAFSSMVRLSIWLRKVVNPLLLANKVETVEDDLCLDPRVGHRLGRAAYAPNEPYSYREGLPAGTTLRVLQERGYLSPGAVDTAVEWSDVPMAIQDGPLEIPQLVHDGFEAEALSPRGEMRRPRDPSKVFGGHSIGGVRTLRGKDGEWGIVCPNSWALWGVNGYCTIPLWLAEWAAIDRPRVLTIPDPEFFLETTKWRELLCLKTELDAWLKQQE